MKMRILDRILLTFYALCILLLAIAVALLAWQVIAPQQVVDTVWMIYSTERWPIIITLIAAAFFILSLKLLFSGAGHRKPQTALIRESEQGSVNLSLQAVDAMVRRYVTGQANVREVKPRLVPGPNGLTIYLKVVFAPETHIEPEATALQTGLAAYIQDYASLNVHKVQILVDTSPGVKPARS